MYTERDTEYMQQALDQAKQDPRKFKVGAVIVTENNEVISAHGGEDITGKAHAEYCALAKCPTHFELVNATIYTTLEPCVEHGRTAPDHPCAEEIITKGIGRVVIGLVDTD